MARWQGELRQRALSIGDSLLADARRDGSASITWDRGYGTAMQPVRDAGLFNGRIGEAFFFAALDSIAQDRRFADAALDATATLRARIADDDDRPELVRELALGLVGCGSILYGLLRIGQWLGRPDFIDDMRKFLAAMTRAVIATDTRYDFFWGAGGLLHGVLAVQESGEAEARDLAHALAEHLLAHRVLDPISGCRAWTTVLDVPSAGFAHGACGIASALLRLYRIAPDARYKAAALESFALERQFRDPQSGDWPDYKNRPTHISGWCHGAPGVALARLDALPVLADNELDAVVLDLDSALERACRDPIGHMDSVCCGTFGRADILLESSIVLENSSLAVHAQRVVRGAIARIDQRGYGINRDMKTGPQCAPGLWQGLAGIGYSLLRASNPARLPSLMRLG